MFADFPFDLHFTIFNFLDPLDILTVGKVGPCSYLRTFCDSDT